ncbi:HAD family hydrolase [Kitasatospora viridis]|uniref:Putative hydrolase of the HAD superfamily n=1 Tax=Kitasatospora viridis TaxID=281105 RepID=A0A561UD68_9ACTN|nr:HAD family hydrolase [Kitasatospora viridis]TWF97299.1 putative hydrolase of the HAD superfamily [Kitasatospora viridis]
MPGIAAISFDADDTLWDFNASYAVAIAAVADRLTEEGVRRADGPVSGEWLDELWTEAGQAAPPGTHLRELRKASFGAALERGGRSSRPDRVDELFDWYNEVRWAELRPYPEVVSVLDELAGRFVLAVTSNGNTDPARVGLGGYFACVTNPERSGYQKPDARMFLHTAAGLDLEPARILHVGDHLQHDAVAARAAGLQAYWLNRRTSGGPASAQAAQAGIREIATLTALLEL